MRTLRPSRSSSKRGREPSCVDRVDKVFGALADATRRNMLEMLCVEARAATEFVRPGLSQPAVSRHLRVLRDAGLIEKRVEGRYHWCILRTEPLREAAAWIARHRPFWSDGLGELAELMEGLDGGAWRAGHAPLGRGQNADAGGRARGTRAARPRD